MHYVKQFNINGVDTKQVACIELEGVPNAATEGAVGVFGMDMTSPTHDVYKCVAVNGSIYTWELLAGGFSVISATVTGEGAISKTFSYDNLLIPNGYLIKAGDLILDSEAYLYKIDSIGASSCNASYCGTHIGGVIGGGKDYNLTIKKGKLQLVTESGNVKSEVEYTLADGDTIYRDSSTGEVTAIGIRTINGTVLRLFVGTTAEFNVLTDAQKNGLFAILTDDTTKEELLQAIKELRENMETASLNIETLNGLKMTSDNGGVKHTWYKVNILEKIIELPRGLHTIYAKGEGDDTCTEMPGNDTCRLLVHVTDSGIVDGTKRVCAWVVAFEVTGKVYTNYFDGWTTPSWKGWKNLYEVDDNHVEMANYAHRLMRDDDDHKYIGDMVCGDGYDFYNGSMPLDDTKFFVTFQNTSFDYWQTVIIEARHGSRALIIRQDGSTQSWFYVEGTKLKHNIQGVTLKNVYVERFTA